MAEFIYIAIDFGTSFSGYAFSLRSNTPDEGKINLPFWGKGQSQKTNKTPTCILFDEAENFMKFGYDALTTYTRLMKQDQAKTHYLFEHFKMELYKQVSTITLYFERQH